MSLALLFALIQLSSCGAAPAATGITCTTTTSSTTQTTTQTATANTCFDNATGVSVTISPATTSVNIVTPLQMLAAVGGATDNQITWQVNGTVGGNDTVGTIDSNGLYRAPAVVPSPATVNVIAVAYDEPAVTASAAVTILPAPTVSVSPTSWTLPAGSANTKAFSATVTGATSSTGAVSTTVKWYVGNALGNVLGGNSTFGTINSSGVYSAPATPPLGSSVIVTAASTAFPLATSSVPVTISGYTLSSLQGPFAFSLGGQILSGTSAGPFLRAGSFSADGAGNLYGGLEDINESTGVTSAFSFIGTYTISADGRGTLKFTDNRAPANLPTILDFVLVGGNQLQITGFDNSGTATFTGTASGQANSQDVTAFTSNPPSALIGTYVFNLSGIHGSNALSLVGEFTADGAGDITGGLLDVNDGGTSSPSNPFQITGNTAAPFTSPIYPSTYAMNSNGRGTVTFATNDPTFPTLTFAIYIVSRGSAKFVELDAGQVVAGATILQQSPNVPFGASTLNGSYAFLLTGTGAGGATTSATAGSFAAGGNSLISAGTLDENIAGTPTTNLTFGGSYTANANGRGTLTFTGGRTYVFYFGPAGNGVFQETDSIHPNISAHGIFVQQQSAAFILSSIQGNYSIGTSGLSGSSGQVISGQFGTNGTGVVNSGAIDINTAGALTPGETVSNGSYLTPASNGRTTLTLNPSTDNRNFAAYVVNSATSGQLQQIFLVGIDSGRVAAGTLYRQY